MTRKPVICLTDREVLWCWHFNYLGGFRRGNCTVKKSESDFSLHPYDFLGKLESLAFSYYV
jgi:hypothetical protein